MISALIQGELSKDPQQRTTQDGQPFAFTSVRVSAGDEAVFISLSIFGQSGADKLMACTQGDAVGATVCLSSTNYTGRDGTQRTCWGSDRYAVANHLRVHEATQGGSGERRGTVNIEIYIYQ
jgi:single-stranded DNA-binding protein